jgi:hypothetical protein
MLLLLFQLCLQTRACLLFCPAACAARCLLLLLLLLYFVC